MWFRDIQHAARTLAKSPAFAATAVFTIALGIGAGTAIFSVVDAVLLRTLPYRDPQRLVLVWSDMRARNVVDFPFSGPDFDDLRRSVKLFEGVAAVNTGRAVVPAENGDAEMIRTGNVTPNFFQLLGARVPVGRDFVETDGTPQPQNPPPAPGAVPAAPASPPLPVMAILSHEYWRKRFHSDTGVVGRSIDFGNRKAQIVGVLEPGFELLFPPKAGLERLPEVWTAMRANFQQGNRNNVGLRLVGRVKPGVAFEQAQAEVESVATGLRERFPIKKTAGVHFRLEWMHQNLVAEVRPAIRALMGAVIFLLLIACANVANLLLLRAGSRSREMAVRAALGGSRWDLVRQMLAESLLIALSGGLLGLGLARLGIDLLVAIAPANLPRMDSVGIDPLVLAFTAAAALGSAFLFGIVPALRASRPDVMEVLRSGGRTAGLGAGRVLRSSVVVAEVALSFVLLIGSGLMIRSFVALQNADPGFDPDRLLTFLAPLNGARTPEQAASMLRDLSARLRALPGVTSVTAASALPLDGSTPLARWGTEEALADTNKFHQANTFLVLPGFFDTVRTRLIDGRAFTEADNNPNAKVVIIDQLMASKAFPNQRAVGKRLLARVITDEAEWYEIIGVVGHQRHDTLAADGREAMFYTDGFVGHGAAARWAVRTAGSPTQVIPQVRSEIARFNKAIAVSDILPMSTYVERAQAQTRFALVLIVIFGVISALLATVGLYGVLSDAVRQRTAEIGLRMALGAAPVSIFRLVVGQGLRLSGMGIAAGVIAAQGLTRLMASMLVGVEPNDVVTFISIAAVFAAIASFACWIPAHRAAGLDPTTALREE